MSANIPFFVGYASLKSELSLEKVGEVLSKKVFAGLEFGGKESQIHEEVPAVFIRNSFMGLFIVLDGYSGFEEDQYFTLTVRTNVSSKGLESEVVRLDYYLYNLLKNALGDIDEVVVVEQDSE